jgi:hypothetical protein
MPHAADVRPGESPRAKPRQILFTSLDLSLHLLARHSQHGSDKLTMPPVHDNHAIPRSPRRA